MTEYKNVVKIDFNSASPYTTILTFENGEEKTLKGFTLIYSNDYLSVIPSIAVDGAILKFIAPVTVTERGILRLYVNL